MTDLYKSEKLVAILGKSIASMIAELNLEVETLRQVLIAQGTKPQTLKPDIQFCARRETPAYCYG